MKNLLLIGVFFVLFLSCNSDDDNKKTIIGKWQLVELCLSDGSTGGESIDCGQIEDGYTVQFYENEEFSFVGVINNNCTTGTYTFNSTKLILQFESNICSDDEGLFIYLYSFVGNDLKLTPSSENPICDEVCYEVFNRITIKE